MKRKVILIALCMALLVTVTTVTAFASSDKYPPLPENKNGDWAIAVSPHGSIKAFDFTYSTTSANNEVCYTYAHEYIVQNGEWVYYSQSYNGYFEMNKILYNESGRFGSNSRDVFVNIPITADDWFSYYEKLTEQISVKNVVAILVVGVTAVVGLVFMWWGARKMVRGIMSAFRKGKISL